MDITRSALVRSFRYNHGYQEYLYSGRRKYDELDDIFHRAAHYALSPADSKKLAAYRLENFNESPRRYFKAKIKQAVKSPQSTYMYRWTENTETANEWSVDLAEMLRQIELGGLQALGFLGEIDILPPLLTALPEYLEAIDPHGDDYRITSEVNFLLRFLMGQHLRIRYIVPREERLERNLPALERVPLATRLKLGDLGDWEVMLRNAREKIEAFTTDVERGEKRSMQLDQEVWSLWDELEKWSLYLEFEPLWYFPLLERKRSLKEWIVDLDRLIQLLEQPGYALPTDLANVEIWSDLVPEGGWHEFE